MAQGFDRDPANRLEDDAATSGDEGKVVLAVRQDVLASSVGSDNDYATLKVNSVGALYDTGGTEYTEGDVDATITGKAILWEDTSDTLRAVSAAKPLPIGDAGGTLTVDAPVGTPVNVKIGDGTLTATVRDTGASDSLNVSIVDASGAQITTFGGTEYAEDTVSSAADKITMAGVVRKDAAATLVDTDGDRSQLQVSATGRLWASATIDAALPAGANAIGKLAANAGVIIGAVEIAAAQTLSTVTTVSTVTAVTAITNALPAGANAIGKLAANSGVDIGDVDVTSLPTASTATITAVNCASSATIFAANASRKGAWITNDGAGILYVKMGATATSTDYSVKIAGGGFYELPGVPYLYTGRIDGIFDGTGAAGDRARATELT